MAIQVLLAASDPTVLGALVAAFPRGEVWEPMAVRSVAQIAEVLMERPPAVAAIHHTLDDATGLQLCQWLGRYSPATQRILLIDGLPGAATEADVFELCLRHPGPPGMLTDAALQLLRAQAGRAQREAFVEELGRRAEQMEAQSYYELLGVGLDAHQTSLRAAYDALSMRFHPDRNMALRGTPAFDRLYALYKRIGEAYRILSDHERRAAYDRQRAELGAARYDEAARAKAGPKAIEDLSDDPQCKRFLKLAQQALATRRKDAALQNLKFALSMDRGNEAIQARIEALEAEK